MAYPFRPMTTARLKKIFKNNRRPDVSSDLNDDGIIEIETSFLVQIQGFSVRIPSQIHQDSSEPVILSNK